MPEERSGEHANLPAGGTSRTGRRVIVCVLALVAVGLAVQVAFSAAQSQPSPATGQDLIVVAGEVSRDAYGLFLVDPANRTICVYQYVPGTQKLRLLASRTFAYDRWLDDYNTEPSPRDIKQMIEQHRQADQPAQ